MRVRYALSLVLVLGCSGAASSEPSILDEVECVRTGAEIPPGLWEPAIEAYEAADAQSPPAPGSIVFIGSSSIFLWRTLAADMAPLPVLNRGFGGSVIAHATHFVDRIILPYEPRAVVLYAGDNDIALGGLSPDCTLRDYEAFVAKIRERDLMIPIYFISIKPSVFRENLWGEMRRANALIEARTMTEPSLHFMDVSESMLDEDGRPIESLFVEDGLHLSPAGYELWTSIVRPVLIADLGD